MGQKTNPNILRIGKIKEWKSKYIEKKATESATLIFRDLEIKKFIFQLFAKSEFRIQNCRVYYSEGSLHVYISYYNSFNPLVINRKAIPKYVNSHSKLFYNKVYHIKKSNVKKQLYTAKTYKKTFLKQPRLKLLETYYFLNKKSQKLDAINNVFSLTYAGIS